MVNSRSVPTHYTFAGEIPWSRQHAYYLRHKNGRIKRHVEDAFGGSEFIPYKRQSKNALSIALEKSDGTLSFILSGGNAPSGKWVKVPGVPVEIPVYSFGWESYHSVINDYSGYNVPTPAISNYLELNYRNQSIELFDKNGKRATIFMRKKAPDSHYSTHLMYLRKDLLERYLADTGQTIVWAIWGERDANYKAMDQRNAEARTDKIYEQHKHIHRTFFQYSDF